MVNRLTEKGASVVIDEQNGKQAKRLIVQVLLPILILASLFALFMRLSQQADAGGMGGFSRWGGKRSKLGPGNAGGPSFADVAGAPGAVAELPTHPWFLAVQFHPEFQSKPLRPHPLFASFVEAAHRHKTGTLDTARLATASR